MTNKLYLKVSDTPFLFGNQKFEVDGKIYYVKHNYDDDESAFDFAKKIIRWDKGGLYNRTIEIKSW